MMTQLWVLCEGTHRATVDIGEMCLNFVLHEDFRSVWGWTIQQMLWTEEMIEGNQGNKASLFRCNWVKLNLSGTKGYNPSCSWVVKVRQGGGENWCLMCICKSIMYALEPTPRTTVGRQQEILPHSVTSLRSRMPIGNGRPP